MAAAAPRPDGAAAAGTADDGALLIARLGPSPVAPPALAALARLLHGLRASLLDAGVPIDSFQGFVAEIDSLPGPYDESEGGLALLGLDPRGHGAHVDAFDATSGVLLRGEPVACVALKPLPAAGRGAGEIKRLFVVPGARGARHGRRMTLRLVAEARARGFSALVLDTLERLPAALALYRELGFAPVPAYVHNPMHDVHFLGLRLGDDGRDAGSDAQLEEARCRTLAHAADTRHGRGPATPAGPAHHCPAAAPAPHAGQ
jgi:GNAT superfamily N-acetyltransferase